MEKPNLKKLIEELHFECLAGKALLDRIPQSAYVSDLLSDVMGKAQADMIWVTSQVHKNIVAQRVECDSYRKRASGGKRAAGAGGKRRDCGVVVKSPRV